MDMILGGELGNTALATIKLPPLKPGTLLVESIFTVHCTAPAHLQLHRYLPLTTIRIVVDINGTHLSKVLTVERLEKLVSKVPKRVAQDLIRQTRQDIVGLIGQTEALALVQQQTVVADALESMERLQGDELQRLTALAERNPNIRQAEVDYLQTSTGVLRETLQMAQCKLEAVRVLVAV